MRCGALAIAIAAAAIVATGLSAPAFADDEIVKGGVVKVEQQEIYVSVGKPAGRRRRRRAADQAADPAQAPGDARDRRGLGPGRVGDGDPGGRPRCRARSSGT